jgi:anti-sigma regulatory factor (Ser/Thr protein kinase)
MDGASHSFDASLPRPGGARRYPRCTVRGFRHEALFYAGPSAFLDGAVPFIRDGLARGEPVMVAVDAAKGAQLRDRLGADADAVELVDIAELGRNPGRIIPAWRHFAGRHAGAPAIRGIGEPIWAGRTAEELVECQLHEALLNLAFERAGDFHLQCPYDTATLPDAVVHEARCSHPFLRTGDAAAPSRDYRGIDDPLGPFDAPLAPPPAGADTLGFERATLAEVRRLVASACDRAGLPRRRRDDLVLAVDELASNSIRHGGGHGVLRVWREADALRCEVRDRGRIVDPLVGRGEPDGDQIGGWGVWIAHQVADLVQVRSGRDGTVVRLRMRCA